MQDARRASAIGRVTAVEGPLERSRLVIAGATGEMLIPLVDGICVSVDPAAQRRSSSIRPRGCWTLNRVGEASGGARRNAGMKIDIVTIFPRMVEAPLAEGIVGRAIARGLLDVRVHDLRDFTTDRHRVVDDMPFGGGPGMVLKPEPLFAAVDRDRGQRAAGRGRRGGDPDVARRRAVHARGRRRG